MKKKIVTTFLSAAIIAATKSYASTPPSITVDKSNDELSFSQGGKIFAEHVSCYKPLFGDNIKTHLEDYTDQNGQRIEIQTSGATERIWTTKGSPFIFAQVEIKNTTTAPIIIDNVIPLSIPLTASPTTIKFFTPEGLAAPSESSSYLFLAAVDPATSAGVVTGWVTHEMGSGIVGSRIVNDHAILEPRSEYGKFSVAPGQTIESQILAIGYFPDAHDGLEQFADANATANHITLKPPISGYCTWYHAHGSNEKDLKALADFAKKENLKDYGFSFLQIDDGWQPKHTEGPNTIRDFAVADTGPKAAYPSGMKATADALNADGFIAGIWFIPFAWSVEDPVLKDHLDWFVQKPNNGGPYSVKWAGDCLDMTNPAARDYLKAAVSRMTHDWGYKYIKIDGLWSGMATTILYPSPKYKPDDLGNAVFFDKTATNISAYRTGLRAVREAAGDDVFICGCNVAQNHRTLGASIGLLDAMRVGPDIKASWDSISTRAAVYATREYFLNGRVWWNDPDCLMLRGPDITVDEARAWASFIAISGQLNVVSEDLAKLPAERFDILKRTLPNIPHQARPLDLFTSEEPQIWQATIGEGESAHTILGLFNWNGTKSATIPTTIPNDNYIGFDYWENKFIDTLPAEMQTAPGSCHVLSLVKNLHRPQLVSTNRHILQGAPDIVELKWDPEQRILRGTSKVVAHDPYELRIASAGYHMTQHGIEGVTPSGITDALTDTVQYSEKDGHGRFQFVPNQTGEIKWMIQFAADK